MPIHHLPLGRLTEGDFKNLITEREREGKTIEYKRIWDASGDGLKRELLADIVSFANAGGGDILYGVETGVGENQGFPVQANGLTAFNADAEELRLQDLCKAWISPRLVGTQCHLVPLANGNGIFVVRIRPGIRRPHMVKFGGAYRFYSRHSNGRYELDVDELRWMFLETETATSRAAEFRLDRIDRIFRNEIGETLEPGTALVLHVQPVQEWDGFDFPCIRALNPELLRPVGQFAGFNPPAINYDGCISTGVNRRDNIVGYVELFRNGVLEAWSWRSVHKERVYLDIVYEEEIRARFPRYLEALAALEIAPPYLVGLTLLGVKGLRVGTGGEGRKIESDILKLAAQPMEDLSLSPDAVLKPIFDRVWNACGQLHSINFEAGGRWIDR